MAEQITPVYRVQQPGYGGIRLHCPNLTALWRAQSLYDKEPETIRWISSFAPGDSLLDVGANMGIYTLFAAGRGHRVLAVEPESQNFGLLNHNIFINGFDDRVTAFNIALANTNEHSTLFLSLFGTANALHTVGEEVDYRHEKMKSAFRQGVLSMTMDTFLDGAVDFFPNHLKIDVDGAEDRIIRGATRTLRDARLKSVLIELNEELPSDRRIVEVMKEHGFIRHVREHAGAFDTGQFSRVYNYIFSR